MSETSSECTSMIQQLDSALLEAVDEGLSIFGDIGKRSMYAFLEGVHNMKREEIPRKLETFHQILQATINTGTQTAENIIIKGLYRRLQLNFEEDKDWSLAKYVSHARTLLKNRT
jgi:hypothetical protein